MLQSLLNAKRVSIFCIINKQDKKVFFNNCIETIPSVLYNIKKLGNELIEDKDKVSFILIETYDNCNKMYLKWRVQELYTEYINLGYTPYSLYKPLQWHLYVGVATGRGDSKRIPYKAIVKLKTSANKVIDIIKYNTIEEADNFVASKTIGDAVRLL